jgi:hypothetical protein
MLFLSIQFMPTTRFLAQNLSTLIHFSDYIQNRSLGHILVELLEFLLDTMHVVAVVFDKNAHWVYPSFYFSWYHTGQALFILWLTFWLFK